MTACYVLAPYQCWGFNDTQHSPRLCGLGAGSLVEEAERLIRQDASERPLTKSDKAREGKRAKLQGEGGCPRGACQTYSLSRGSGGRGAGVGGRWRDKTPMEGGRVSLRPQKEDS